MRQFIAIAAMMFAHVPLPIPAPSSTNASVRPPTLTGWVCEGAPVIYSASTNLCNYETDDLLSQGGYLIGTASKTLASADCPIGPDGHTRMTLVNMPAQYDGWINFAHPNIGAGKSELVSIWIANRTGDSACTLHAGNYDASVPNVLSVGASFSRLMFTTAASGDGSMRPMIRSNAGADCTRACFWGLQGESPPPPQPGPYHSVPYTAGPATWASGKCRYP